MAEIIASLPEGEWARVNLNTYKSVWTPESLRPLRGQGNPAPNKIIQAWSSFAWDSNRSALILYGGGHANYTGNDVYIWRSSTRLWERAALPSQVKFDPAGNLVAVDGPDHAPASAHTYDNNIFLPIIDRMLALGGAAETNGGHFLRHDTSRTDIVTSRKTGPYLFDPNRADPNKVGGTTGSHVQRVGPYAGVVGGEMWSNRENWQNPTGAPSNAFVNGCTAYAEENGKDVVYVRNYHLYRYTINDLNDPTRDRWEVVGIFWGGPGDKTACGMDPVGKTFVRLATNATPFVYWDLSKAGTGNRDVSMTPTDPTGEFPNLLANNQIRIRDCGLDFDRVRRKYALWCGDGRVWMLKAPEPLSPNGWTIEKQPAPSSIAPVNGQGLTGVLGKWEYAPELDVFVALEGEEEGNVWIYKPIGGRGP